MSTLDKNRITSYIFQIHLIFEGIIRIVLQLHTFEHEQFQMQAVTQATFILRENVANL
jgi:hypothetical protein